MILRFARINPYLLIEIEYKKSLLTIVEAHSGRTPAQAIMMEKELHFTLAYL